MTFEEIGYKKDVFTEGGASGFVAEQEKHLFGPENPYLPPEYRERLARAKTD